MRSSWTLAGAEWSRALVETSQGLFKETAHLPPVCLSRAVKPGKWKEGEPWWTRRERVYETHTYVVCTAALRLNRLGLVHAIQQLQIVFVLFSFFPLAVMAIKEHCTVVMETLWNWSTHSKHLKAVLCNFFACQWPQMASVGNLRSLIQRNLRHDDTAHPCLLSKLVQYMTPLR